MSQAFIFFDALFGASVGGGRVITTWTLPNKASKFHHGPQHAADEVAKLIAEEERLGVDFINKANTNKSRQAIFFGCGMLKAKPKKGRGVADDVASISAFWLDIDIEPGNKTGKPENKDDAKHLLDKLGFTPSFMVCSGGGYHAYFLLTKPVIFDGEEDRAICEEIESRLIQTANIRSGYKLDSVKDLARILRVPGTWNHKEDEPRHVFLTDAQMQPIDTLEVVKRYTLEELESCLVEPEIQQIKPTKTEWDYPVAVAGEVEGIRQERVKAFVDSSMGFAVEAIATAQDGSRNESMNKGVFKIGRLVGGGLLDMQTAIDISIAAAETSGCEERSISNIERILKCGTSKPKYGPDGGWTDNPKTRTNMAAVARIETVNISPQRITADNIIPIFAWVHSSNKGEPKPTLENVQLLLHHYGITVKYDQIMKEVVYYIPGEEFLIDNCVNNYLKAIQNLMERNDFKKVESSIGYVDVIADRNSFNPVKEWITSKPWDGKNRFMDLLDTITVAPHHERMRNLLMERWMIGAVNSACSDKGAALHGVLVFQGEQGDGKGKWFKSLTGEMGHLVKEGRDLDLRNKDTKIQALTCWICELAELGGTLKKDIDALKAFLTSDSDEMRLPYARSSSRYPRRTAFCSSVNEGEFLDDPTGSRRFWTIPIKSINWKHGIDMQQLWAQIMVAWKDPSAQWWLTKEEQATLETHNGSHKKRSAVWDLIDSRYDWEEIPAFWKSATDILSSVGLDKPTNPQTKEVASYAHMAGLEKRKYRGSAQYLIPSKL